jgi:hypothetical protein
VRGSSRSCKRKRQRQEEEAAQGEAAQGAARGRGKGKAFPASEHCAASATASAMASASASATASAITNNSSSAQAAFTGGLSNSKINSRQGPPEVPSNLKIIPQTLSRTEIEKLINFLKVWSRSDRERTVYIVIILIHSNIHHNNIDTS